MNILKRVFMVALVLIMLLCVVPLGQLRAQAAQVTGGYDDALQYALTPVNYLYVERTNAKLDPDQVSNNEADSGHRAYAFDLNQTGASGEYKKDTQVYAPFDMKVIAIEASHSVFVESLRPVRLANGMVDYITCIFTHDDDINKNVKVGAVIKQNEWFYDQGTYGRKSAKEQYRTGVFGKHLHIEVALGRVCSTKNSYTKNLDAVRDNGIQINDVFFLKPDTEIGKKTDIYVSQTGTTVYLNWKRLRQVQFHSNVSGTKDLVRYYPQGDTFGLLPTPKNPGKSFEGWYTAKTGGTRITNVASVPYKDTHLYARWSNDASANAKNSISQKAKMSTQSVTATDGQISLSVDIGTPKLSFKVGFYIGTNANYLTRCDKTQKVTGETIKKGVSFQLSKYSITLQPDTTYYYQFYAAPFGNSNVKNELCSEVKSFKTAKAPATVTKTGQAHLQWVCPKPSGITEDSATISATINSVKGSHYSGGKRVPHSKVAQKVKVEYHGFYIGTERTNLTKSATTTKVNASQSTTKLSYDLSNTGTKLKAGTTYYYQFYAVVGGAEYKSGIMSFKTKGSSGTTSPKPETGLNPTWSKYNAASITQTNASISATVNYGKTLKADKCGFYLGTSQNSLTKASKSDTISQSRKYTDMWYDLNKYGFTLKPGTTYYYQFYIVISGKEYKSAVKSFTSQQSTHGAPDETAQTQPAAPKLSPTWSKYSASDITATNATIAATVTYGKTLKADACGFYLGTAQDQLTKAEKYDTITQSRSYTDMWYDLNKYGFTLKPGTTYYYRLYLVVEGQEYLSDVKSFTTAKAELSPVWSEYKVSNVTKTNATIAAKVTYGKSVKPERCGFYIGTTRDNLQKAEKYDPINATRTYSGMSYGMNKYGYTLKAGTTYYYRFYVIVNGVEYLSDIQSFTTSK